MANNSRREMGCEMRGTEKGEGGMVGVAVFGGGLGGGDMAEVWGKG